ncbi:hypothetical protein UlMin_028541 [Ulmus minor]
MASSSSSSAAAEPRLPKHDVFLSFRGEDTRNNFTAHLYSALSGKQIGAYIDQVSLKQGSEISPELLKAIEESEISIIIFSKNYASSSWCLDELVHILKCKKEKARIVLPIFLGIDPSHIRKQKSSYAEAFVGHEERFEMEKVREWRRALTDAAGLSGWDSRNMSESKILEEVVERVKRELDTINSKRSDDFKGLVGIPECLEKIKSFLDSPSVCVVGIWGMGGIGKTTLARVVFNQFYNDFENSYFAPNVRENALKKGLGTLEREVYSQLFDDKNLDTFKSSAVNRRLRRTKVLLVLDDVETPMQLKCLAGDRYLFGRGSKIIVTGRHKLVVDAEYKVEVLDFDDACKLFYLNAFGKKCCKSGYKEISDRVVEYTKCHPLAVEVLGASVFCFLESIEDWEKELEKLKRIPHYEIQAVLERSYDALDGEEKGLFLDIACFFKGERRDIVLGILADKPIAGLVHKSLITIEDDKIQMHDLIQEMGRNIVLRSTETLGERSRLWIAQDVSFVLENNRGTEAIEGIYLPWNQLDEELHLRPDVFEEMRKLRLLKFYDANPMTWHPKFRHVNKVYIDGVLKYLPNGLRYLHWERYPGKSLPSNFKPQYLVELEMPNSKLEQLWDGVQKLGSLKHINLRYSQLLTKIPDLSLAPKLESINLSSCQSLIHIPSLNFQATLDESAYQCQQKVFYRLYGEHKRTPGGIILSSCRSLTTLPKVCGNITKLVLIDTSLENLLVLDLRRCKKLKSLPKLPRNIEVLNLGHSGIEQIPSSSIECLCSLRILSLRYCRCIESLPSNINLKALEELDLVGTSIQELPSTIENSIRLRRICLEMCNHLEFIPNTLCKLNRLQELSLSYCSKLESLPASIGMLYKLKTLDISYCKNLQSLPELPLFIVSVNAEGCSSLEMVSTLRSTLTLGRWLYKYDSDNYCNRREFSFLNCTNLGEDAINNIFREFLYKVFCTATTPPEVVHSVSKVCDH